VARPTPVNVAIAKAFKASGLTLRGAARKLYGTADRHTELKQIMDGVHVPRTEMRIRIAVAFGKPWDEFLEGDPLMVLAKELSEVTRLMESNFEKALTAIERLYDAVDHQDGHPAPEDE
jgi:hypothetical protein